jgi:hypothetical protein
LKGLYYVHTFSDKRAENGGMDLTKEQKEVKVEKINEENIECQMCSG